MNSIDGSLKSDTYYTLMYLVRWGAEQWRGRYIREHSEI
jgi:hypothetical protein